MRHLQLSALFLLATPFLTAQSVPTTINYQGRLTDNSPQQNPLSGVYPMKFDLFLFPTIGASLWTETSSVTVTGGIFNVELGATTPIDASLFGSPDRYLAITLNPGASQEVLAPRQHLSMVGYAAKAQNAALAASATTATTATNATQLGGVASGSWQRSLSLATCPANQFYNAIAQGGTAACATPSANNLTPPVILSTNLATPNAVLSATNSGTGRGLYGSGRDGVWGESGITDGTGVHGLANTGTLAYGVLGESTSGHGVHGTSTSGIAGYFEGSTGIQVTAGGTGITVSAFGSDGVIATSTAAGGNGLQGIANNGTNAYGVWGQSTSGFAGYFSGKVNITGKATSIATVAADSSTTLTTKGYVDAAAVVPNPLSLSGSSTISTISGSNSGTGAGVLGSGGGYGVYGTTSVVSAPGIYGTNTNAGSGYGVQGVVTSGQAVYGNATSSGWGVHGQSASDRGVFGESSSSTGVYGTSTTGSAGQFIISNAASGATALYASTTGTGSGLTVIGTSVMSGDLFMNSPAHINFGSLTRQVLNLWGTPDGNGTSLYGVGVQGNTEYFRTSPTGGFAWHSGGTHSNTQNDPGAGGTKLMGIDNSGNISQPPAAAGAVKAMAYILANGTIVRCYNGGLASGPSSTIPCGMTVSNSATNFETFVNFGFQVDNRFVSLTAATWGRFIGFIPSGNSSVSVAIRDSDNFGFFEPFMIFIY